MQCILIIFTSSLLLPDPTSPLYPPTKCLLIFFNIKCKLCCPYILTGLAFHWSVVHLQEATFLKCSPSPKLPIENISSDRACVHLLSLCWDFFLTYKGFVHAIPIALSSYMELPYCVQRIIFLLSTTVSDSYSVSFPSSTMIQLCAYQQLILTLPRRDTSLETQICDSAEILELSRNFGYGKYGEWERFNNDISALLEIIFRESFSQIPVTRCTLKSSMRMETQSPSICTSVLWKLFSGQGKSGEANWWCLQKETSGRWTVAQIPSFIKANIVEEKKQGKE